MRHLIKSTFPDYIQHLSEYGFVVIDFLNPTEVGDLRNHFTRNREKIAPYYYNGIHMTTWIADNHFKLTLKEELEKLILKPCSIIFDNYKLLNTTYIIKKKHQVSNFPIHQDWSFVDETKNEALNLWIALQDTTVHNGGLYIIKGSHKLNNVIRGSGKLSFDFEQYRKNLTNYLTPIQVKAGQAVIFYYSLIHGSPPNLTNQPRLVVATTVLPEEAEIILNYYNEEQRRLEQYRMEDDFIYKYKNIREESTARPPHGTLINVVENYTPETIRLKDIKRTALTHKNSFIYKLMSIFNKQDITL